MQLPAKLESRVQPLPSYERDAIARILRRLTLGLNAILRDQLVGIYLYGSLVTGDFDFEISDIDLVVVLGSPLNDRRFEELDGLHTQVVRLFPAWDDRLELAYISANALQSFRTQSSRIGIISPGEPFHRIEAGADWLISWYDLRLTGIALQGPEIKTLIEFIPRSVWLEAIREHICLYRETVETSPNGSSLSYIVLTVARGLFTLEHRKPDSKLRAAEWAAIRYPQWEDLIKRALRYRRDPAADATTAEQLRAEVRNFVRNVLPEKSCAEAASSD